MPDRSFETFAVCCWTIGAAGDVVGARQIARDLLTLSPSPASDSTLATLVLAAVCLQIDARASSGVTPFDVAACLRDLADEEHLGAALAASPMQFVRYAAVELRALSTVDRKTLIDFLIRLMESIWADEDCEQERAKQNDNAHKVPFI